MFGMIKKLVSRVTKKKVEDQAPPVVREEDPLDPNWRSRHWKSESVSPIRYTAKDFMASPAEQGFMSRAVVGDAKFKANVADDGTCGTVPSAMESAYVVPDQLANWYMSQSFIGYQACAYLAQHWLVDKACTMAGEDAARHGWELNVADEQTLTDEQRNAIKQWDIDHNIKQELIEFSRFKNVFGIRVALFEVASEDKDYYAKPFNPDGVTEGSYKGISQVDPYWMMPMLTTESTSDPSSKDFYEPEYWVISGRRYHRSHLVIIRGPEPADILKPTYIFGGIPLTQRIYERVYAAERTANESPLLAMSKRTTALYVDLDQAIANQDVFTQKIGFWARFRDNFAVKVLGLGDKMEQFDTSLSDFDSVIMNQYQIAAAVAEVPSTKLLGTSPKGFNATGEFEQKSYHEKLESVQEHEHAPLLNRHYLVLAKSLGIDIRLEVVFNPVDSMTAKEQAELNNTQADVAQKYVATGIISPDEARTKLRDDPRSGFNRLEDTDANENVGMSPENLVAFAKAGAEREKSEAASETAEARQVTAGAQQEKVQSETAAGGQEEADDAPGAQGQLYTPVPGATERKEEAGQPTAKHVPSQGPVTVQEPGIDPPGVAQYLGKLTEVIERLSDHLVGEGQEVGAAPGRARAVQPSVSGLEPTIRGMQHVVGETEPYKLPKTKIRGMVITVENPRGTIRKGMKLDGSTFSQKMPHHYGFIKGVGGADGDELDCFVGPNVQSDKVFVINQVDPDTGEFDEHKVMFGFDSEEEAYCAYTDSYQPGWKGFKDMHELSFDQFREWTKDGQCYSPLSAECIAQTTSALQTA